MGQGAEDAGGYELEYNPAYEGLSHNPPRWNDSKPVDEMSCAHLRYALRVSKSVAGTSSFTCDDDTWETWIDVLEQEIHHRAVTGKKIKSKNDFRLPRKKGTGKKGKETTKKRIEEYKAMTFTSSKVQMRCHCGKEYTAKVADLRRGWATSCSKRCAAIRREFGRPVGKLID